MTAASASARASLDHRAVAAALEARSKAASSRIAGKPIGPNPFLAYLPAGAGADYEAWKRWMGAEARAASLGPSVAPPPSPPSLVIASEVEPNDGPASAQRIDGFGSAAGLGDQLQLFGVIGDAAPPDAIGPFPEDDGAIPLASPTGLADRAAVRVGGVVGDGPHGSAGGGTGDFDVFALAGLAAGDEIEIDVDTPTSDLDSVVSVWDEAGNLIAVNDDAGTSFDSFLRVEAPSAGAYFVFVAGFGSSLPGDPFDPASGFGVGSEGAYEVTIARNAGDRDFYALDLRPGDVVSARVAFGGDVLALRDPSAILRVRSDFDSNVLVAGPVLRGGLASLTYVAEVAGEWSIAVGGRGGPYKLELEVLRPGFQRRPYRSVQTLFVDLDGAFVDPRVFGGFFSFSFLSPLSAFLGDFGLAPEDESALVDRILAVIEENLSADLRVLAPNGDYDASAIDGEFDVVLLNSRDHGDPWGERTVSRVIVGGTIFELGLFTIGIAESVDVGNFAGEESAVVLLDTLSGPDVFLDSLNAIPLAPGASKLELVARGIGNIASHEAGHLLASFHTELTNDVDDLMDSGGDVPRTVGVGPDSVFGTADDVDVDFGSDAYAVFEGLAGTEDTRSGVAFGLSTGASVCDPVPLGGCRLGRRSELTLRDKPRDAGDAIVFRWSDEGRPTTFADARERTYRLCIYDTGRLLRAASAPAGERWRKAGRPESPAFRFRDGRREPDGTSRVDLKSSATKPQIVWQAKGVNVFDAPLRPIDDIDEAIKVEVHEDGGGTCFAACFDLFDDQRNQPDLYKARSGSFFGISTAAPDCR